MFLSRLRLNPRSREVRRDLADVYQLHRTIMAGFAQAPTDAARESLAVLFRVEPATGPLPTVVVQSRPRPSWELPTGYLAPGHDVDCKPITELLDLIQTGSTYHFRLLANPCRKIARFDQHGTRLRQGRRVDLRSDEERIAWLERKGAQHGFGLARVGEQSAPDVLLRSAPRHVGRRSGARITVAGVLFEGRLTVQDTSQIRAAIIGGVGPGKAFGFSLLSLASDR